MTFAHHNSIPCPCTTPVAATTFAGNGKLPVCPPPPRAAAHGVDMTQRTNANAERPMPYFPQFALASLPGSSSTMTMTTPKKRQLERSFLEHSHSESPSSSSVSICDTGSLFNSISISSPVTKNNRRILLQPRRRNHPAYANASTDSINMASFDSTASSAVSSGKTFDDDTVKHHNHGDGRMNMIQNMKRRRRASLLDECYRHPVNSLRSFPRAA